jgi:uncharacterized membrane protein
VTLGPLAASAPSVVIHTVFAAAALILGAAVLLLKKGTPLHMALGRTWAVLMMATAAISFVMVTHYSWIHVLSVVTLVNIPYAIWRRRVGDVRAHATAMIANYCGLFIAAGFTLAPGRVMHAVVFG